MSAATFSSDMYVLSVQGMIMSRIVQCWEDVGEDSKTDYYGNKFVLRALRQKLTSANETLESANDILWKTWSSGRNRSNIKTALIHDE